MLVIHPARFVSAFYREFSSSQALLCFEQHGLSLLGPYFPVCALEYFFCVSACDLIRVISIQWQCTISTVLEMF